MDAALIYSRVRIRHTYNCLSVVVLFAQISSLVVLHGYRPLIVAYIVAAVHVIVIQCGALSDSAALHKQLFRATILLFLSAFFRAAQRAVAQQ